MPFPAGIKFDGSKCTCACHTEQAMHIMACCRPIDPSEAHTVEHYVFNRDTLESCIRWNPGISGRELTQGFKQNRESWHSYYEAMDRLIFDKLVLCINHTDWGAGARQTLRYFWMGDADIRIITGAPEEMFSVTPTIFTYDPFDAFGKERD